MPQAKNISDKLINEADLSEGLIITLPEGKFKVVRKITEEVDGLIAITVDLLDSKSAIEVEKEEKELRKLKFGKDKPPNPWN